MSIWSEIKQQLVMHDVTNDEADLVNELQSVLTRLENISLPRERLEAFRVYAQAHESLKAAQSSLEIAKREYEALSLKMAQEGVNEVSSGSYHVRMARATPMETKIPVIKAIRVINPGIGLKEAKDISEQEEAVVKMHVGYWEAQFIVELIDQAGGEAYCLLLSNSV